MGHDIHQASGGSTITVSEVVYAFNAAPARPVDPAAVAAAEALLATLPVDAVPEHRGLPALHRMPWPRNHFFTGRETDLLGLARHLRVARAAAIGQSPVLTGLGGQGKTQLAVEFAYRYGDWFAGGVFWVDCAVPEAMAEAVAACGSVLYREQPGFSALPLPERVALVGAAWASSLPRLLIFDNCEYETLLDDWAPKGGGCRLLVTARRQSWSAARGVLALPLGALARHESLSLLSRHRPDLPPQDPGLDAIAEELGDLPLALELAGRYLHRYRHEPGGTPAAYLAALRAADPLAHESLAVEDPEAPGHTRLLTGHEAHVAKTFLVSLGRLRADRAEDAWARDLFARAAWLSPGTPIPRFLLKLCAGIAPGDSAAGLRLADALNRLTDLALVEPAQDGAVILHRLLAAFGRARLEQSAAARSAVEAALANEARRLLSHHDPTPFRPWATHLMAVALAARRDGTAAAVHLMNDAGCYSRLAADLALSQVLLEDALALAEVLCGPDDPSVASSLGNLSLLQHERGDLAAAEASLMRVQAIFEKAYGPDDLEVAKTLDNLGVLQKERGDLAVAEASHTRAQTIFEQAFGPDHPKVARNLGNLGIVQHARGDLASAEASHTRALAILEKTYGSDNPDVARALGNLGNVQNDLGDCAAAVASQTRALAIKEKVYGPDHPEVARSLINLGIVQNDRGDLAAAAASHTRALAINEKVHGLDHPDVALSLASLGIVDHQLGNLAAALASQTRALAIKEKVYGPDHSAVAVTLTNLGNLERDQGRTAEARMSFLRAATIFAARLGEQHPHTMLARRLMRELGNGIP